MKKIFVILLTLILVISLLSACGKENSVQKETAAPTVSTTAPVETTAAMEETIPETEPPEPISIGSKIEIDMEIYTIPILATDLTNNGWEFSSDKDFFLGEGDYISGTFTRNGLIFPVHLTGTPGGTIYDEDVVVSNMQFQIREGYAFAILSDCFYAGMSAADIIPNMETMGFLNIDTLDFGDGDTVIIGYLEEPLYSVKFYVENDVMAALEVDYD